MQQNYEEIRPLVVFKQKGSSEVLAAFSVALIHTTMAAPQLASCPRGLKIFDNHSCLPQSCPDWAVGSTRRKPFGTIRGGGRHRNNPMITKQSPRNTQNTSTFGLKFFAQAPEKGGRGGSVSIFVVLHPLPSELFPSVKSCAKHNHTFQTFSQIGREISVELPHGM